MYKKSFMCAAVITASLLSGCASVPMGSMEQDSRLKSFATPAADKAGLYIFRDSFMGQGLKKTVAVDGATLGETANKVYFYKEITPGQHLLSTESEFSDNTLNLQADAGKNYYVAQFIKIGFFVGGADLKQVSETEGKQAVRQCSLAK